MDDSSAKGEIVRINVPLSLAEKVIPAIKADNLRDGKIKINGNLDDVDLRTLLEAVRTTADGEFVTVQEAHENVRIAKTGGYLLIKVREDQGRSSKVDIKVPITVVDALLSSGKDELDLAAAIRALRAHGDTELLTVNDKSQSVRIWIDTRNTSE